MNDGSNLSSYPEPIVPSLCRCVGLPLRVSSFLHGAAHISNHVLNKERLEAASIVQFAKFAISTRQHKPKKCTQPTRFIKVGTVLLDGVRADRWCANKKTTVTTFEYTDF